MGRKITSEAHQQFTYIQTDDKSVCKLCKEVMKGHHATNLKKHLMRCQNFSEDQFGSAALTKKSSYQPTMNEINTIKIEISKEILIDACVELVTVNGRPFSLMEDSGLKKILEPIKAGLLRKTKDNFSLSSESIQKYVTREADALKEKIIGEVKNCMVSVKVDCVNRLDRSFLGINIQYTKNGQIFLRTLALKEITSQHTGNNLKRLIMEACNSFQIGIDNIYSITTDNGSNLLKAIKIIASENGEYDVGNEIDNDDQDEFVLFGDNADHIEIFVEDDQDLEGNRGTGARLDIGSDAFFEILYKNFNDFNNDAPSTSTSTNLKLKVTGIRCAAHTLQLAIEDSLKQTARVQKLILEVRKVVKTLRTQTFLYMLRKQNLKKPILDCTTRWGSTFDMLKVLLELKGFCREMQLTNFNNFKNLCESDWCKIEEVVCALEPVRKCTKKLQYEQLTLGSFYGYWQECKLTTEKIGTSFARTILENMKCRESMLFDNDVFLAGLFLDPRFKVVLNPAQMERAKSHLKQLWTRLLSLREIASVDAEIEDNDMETTSVGSDSSNDDMKAFLKKKETENKMEQGFGTPSKNSFMSTKKIENILNSFQIEQERIRLTKNSTIFQFWETKKEIMPELYLLAQILLGVPATQVSVERLFSGLKFLLPPTRSNIKDTILEAQLFLRTNRTFEKKEEKMLFAVTKNNPPMPTSFQQGSGSVNDTGATDPSENEELKLKGKKRKSLEQQSNNLKNYLKKKQK